MKKPDWFKFFVEKWAGSKTRRSMSLAAQGAYMNLLCDAWHQDPPGSLPDDDAWLAEHAEATPREWARVSADVRRALEKRADGRLYQSFMADVIAPEGYERIDKARSAARAKWDAVAMRKQCVSNATAETEQCHQDPDPEQSRVEQTQKTPPAVVSVGDLAAQVAVDRAVRTLKVSALVRERVGGLGGLTVREIADTFAAVKRDALDPLTQPPIRDVDATVASRLLAARGQAMPTRKTGNLAGSLTGAVAGMEGLQSIRRNRMGTNA